MTPDPIWLVTDPGPYSLGPEQTPVLNADRKRKFSAKLKGEFARMVFDGEFTVTANETLILACMANHCDCRGVVDLPVMELVRKTRLSRTVVFRVLRTFEDREVIRCRSKRAKGIPMVYEIAFIAG